ncbi:MAG: transposase [Pseudonocardiaceae bacterium]
MAVSKVAPRRGVAQIAALLDSPEIMGLIGDLQETRWTGRPGYPIRAMVGLALVKAVYALPTWSRTVRLVGEHAALQDVLGDTPSADAAYRFAVKLRKHSSVLETCLDRVLAELREVIPDLGAHGGPFGMPRPRQQTVDDRSPPRTGPHTVSYGQLTV